MAADVFHDYETTASCGRFANWVPTIGVTSKRQRSLKAMMLADILRQRRAFVIRMKVGQTKPVTARIAAAGT